MMDFVNDFLRGQQDCKNGVPHKPGQGDYYDRGYASQYELEQVMTHHSNHRFNVMGYGK